MIAMMIVGGLCPIAYVVYEIKWARMPSAPRRLVFNKTFVMCIVIDFIYMRMPSFTIAREHLLTVILSSVL